MVRMSTLPVGKYHDARFQQANDARDLEAVVPRVLHTPVGDVERVAPSHLQDARSFGGFAPAIVGSAARTHLTACQVEDAGAQPALCMLQQRAATGLLYIVAMSGDGENVDRGGATVRH